MIEILDQKPSFRTDLKSLEQILKTLQSVTNEPTISLDPSGLFFRSMDSSHVSMVDIRLPETIFQTWNIKNEIKISFDVKEFLKIVKSLNKKQSVLIEISENEILIANKDTQATTKLREGSSNDYPLPRLTYDATLEAKSQDFKNLLKSVQSVCDSFTIKMIDQTGSIHGKKDQGEIFTTIGKEISVKNSSDVFEVTYSFEYLTPFLKSIPKDSNIQMGFSAQKPCRLTTSLNNIGKIDFYLAPRMEY